MSDSTVRGVVNVIEETKTYGQKGFRKRLVVLEQDKGSFSNYIPIEFTRDACVSVEALSYKVVGASGGNAGAGADAANDAFNEVDDEAPF